MKDFLIKIREDMPETNSSSSHAVIIGRGNLVKDSLKIDDDGIIRIPGNVSFGWELEIFKDPLSKIQYAAGLVGRNSSKRLNLLKSVIKNYTGAKDVEFCWGSNSEDFPSVDHQSSDLFYEVWESPATLKDFIFSEDSMIITGNDNGGTELLDEYRDQLLCNASITIDFSEIGLGEVEFRVKFNSIDSDIFQSETFNYIESRGIVMLGKKKSFLECQNAGLFDTDFKGRPSLPLIVVDANVPISYSEKLEKTNKINFPITKLVLDDLGEILIP